MLDDAFQCLLKQTRILVTHGLSFLPQADLILVMEDGEITEMGSYAKLLSRKNAFADFVKAFSVSECKESATHRGKIKECLMSYYNKTFFMLTVKNANSSCFRDQKISISTQHDRLLY